MSPPAPRSLFEAYGVELEYMVVDAGTLAVRPLADEALRALAGESDYVADAEMGPITASNELVAHVLEFKTTLPARNLAGWDERFATAIGQANQALAAHNARLMPTAMHPWMDPRRETKLWPHEGAEFYTAFDQIFNCRRHGWANLQSVHLNLPFAGDDEFARLHAAVRLLLPILPALAASSPVVERRLTGLCDNRLNVYRSNSRQVPSIAGTVIPEAVFSEPAYRERIFEPMYAAVAPFDPEGVLRHEWLNARGAIARFDRQTIEIRLLDVQECPRADLAVCAAVAGVAQALVAGRWSSLASQQAWSEHRLHNILWATMHDADEALIFDLDYLRAFGLPGTAPVTAGQLWRHLLLPPSAQAELAGAADWTPTWEMLLAAGAPARRIAHAWQADPSPAGLAGVYGQLCDCLASNSLFAAGAVAGAATM